MLEEFYSELVDYEQEIAPILQDVYQQSGIDYRNYSRSFLARRVSAFCRKHNLASFEDLHHEILANDNLLFELAGSLSLPTTRMFRDSAVYSAIRHTIIPLLAKTNLTKIWSAGCSTGEEPYSLSIILKEEIPNRKVITFATDFSERSLITAKKGIYSLRRMRAYTTGYLSSGGKNDFSKYYSADDQNAMMSSELKKEIVFAQHNLVTDSSFNEFDLILCRNVLIYFNRKLQEHVMELLSKSLRPGGVLILGDKESLRSFAPSQEFNELERPLRIFQKRG